MASLPRRLDALEKGLDALGPDHDAMMLGELDGFIAGILVSPVEIEPEEWLAHIWRDVGEDGVTRLDMRAAEALVPDILDHYRRVSLELKVGEDGYMPIYYTSPDDGSIVWEPWAAGFGEAMQLRMDAWTAVAAAEDDAVVEAVIGLMAAVSVAHGTTLEELAKTEENGADFAAMFEEIDELLPLWVETLFDWRLIHRPEPVQAPVRVVHIGRNDPCLCGSGKKYKKCCGSPAAG